MTRRLYEGVDGIRSPTNEIPVASASSALIPVPCSLHLTNSAKNAV